MAIARIERSSRYISTHACKTSSFLPSLHPCHETDIMASAKRTCPLIDFCRRDRNVRLNRSIDPNVWSKVKCTLLFPTIQKSNPVVDLISNESYVNKFEEKSNLSSVIRNYDGVSEILEVLEKNCCTFLCISWRVINIDLVPLCVSLNWIIIAWYVHYSKCRLQISPGFR